MKHFFRLSIAVLPFAGWLAISGACAQSPTVVGTGLSPARNAVAGPRTAPVVLPFSQVISPGTAGNIKLFSSQAGGRRTATASTSASTVTLTPTAPAGLPAAFRPGETVLVTVPATVQSAAGAAAVPHVHQFTAAATGGSGRLLAGSNPSVGTNPRGVTLGDIDGDGDLDCVTPNSSPTFSPTMASKVYNYGGGFFGISFGIEVGPQSTAVALADMDGDGDLDLVAANSGNNTASVRVNNGHSNFATTPNTVAVAVGANPKSIAVGDLDGDLDVVTANAGSFAVPGNTVSVRFNALDGNVVSTAPARHALAVPPNAAPALTFRQPLDPATVGGVRLHRQQGPGLHPASASGATLTLAAPAGPHPAFWPGEAVQITVPATVSSVSGTAPVPFVYDFTAAATGGTAFSCPSAACR